MLGSQRVIAPQHMQRAVLLLDGDAFRQFHLQFALGALNLHLLGGNLRLGWSPTSNQRFELTLRDYWEEDGRAGGVEATPPSGLLTYFPKGL